MNQLTDNAQKVLTLLIYAQKATMTFCALFFFIFFHSTEGKPCGHFTNRYKRERNRARWTQCGNRTIVRRKKVLFPLPLWSIPRPTPTGWSPWYRRPSSFSTSQHLSTPPRIRKGTSSPGMVNGSRRDRSTTCWRNMQSGRVYRPSLLTRLERPTPQT